MGVALVDFLILFQPRLPHSQNEEVGQREKIRAYHAWVVYSAVPEAHSMLKTSIISKE